MKKMRSPIVLLSVLVNVIVCRDFYVGMFKRNDVLVAQDRVYKEKVYYSRVVAKYGRVFKCPITYLRIVDRLGIGRGPTVQIIRGGLLRNFVVLRLQSVYNYPISVNIYVGCENKLANKTTLATTVSTTGKTAETNVITTGETNVITTGETNVITTEDTKANATDASVADETTNSTTTVSTADNNYTVDNNTAVDNSTSSNSTI